MNSGYIVEFTNKDDGLTPGILLSVGPKGLRILTLQRREVTIQDRQIRHSGPQSTLVGNDIDQALEILSEADQKRRELVSSIDLAALHGLLLEEPRAYTIQELAEFLGRTDDHFLAALHRRLARDTWYFREKKEGLFPNSLVEVAATREREEKRIKLEREEEVLLDFLKALPGATSLAPELQPHLPHLEQLAIHGEEANIPRKFLDLATKAGLLQPRKLFQALVQIGRFSEDENLWLRRLNVPRQFSSEAQKEAAFLSSVPHTSEGRDDLRDLHTWVIDNTETRDRDDGFSIQAKPDGGFLLWVHIADGAHWIAANSALSKEASRRGTSIYMPDDKLHMLPPILSEGHLSLNTGMERTTLTQKISFSPEGQVLSHQFLESIITTNEAIDYTTADQRSAEETDLKLGLLLATNLRRRRVVQGGLLLSRPELEVKVRDGAILVSQRPERSPCQEMIAEFMIWANHLAAVWCREHRVPCLYRAQEAPEEPIALSEQFDPVVFYKAVRRLKRSFTSAEPARHAGLGVGLYCQITSPLRRYSDLLLQRQVKAFLQGHRPFYSDQELTQTIMLAENATDAGEEVMTRRYRYFLLKHLQRERDAGRDTAPVVAVDVSGAEIQFYNEHLCEFAHARRPGFAVTAGQRLMVRYLQVDPYENLLRYELSAPVPAVE